MHAVGVILVYKRQTFKGKHSGVSEANAPGTKPSALGFLFIMQKLDSSASGGPSINKLIMQWLVNET